MTALDWMVIATYLVGMIGFSVYVGRGHSSQEDYFVGGRNLPWWAVGISTMATQTSAISFISIPAFVALKTGGGLTWLQYELAVPLALIVVMVFLIPFFRRLQLVSVYGYLERRFSPSVRYLVSFVFLMSRALGTSVGVYASAIVLSVCLETPLWLTILIIGVVTIIYDTLGGMTAVVYSDVIQMVILLSGIGLCIFYAVDIVGGFGNIFHAIPPGRLRTIDPSTGLGDGGAVPFWAFLIGGLFLYTSYYGTDQSQVQRELSAPTTDETKKSLVFNAIARFPLTVLYVLMGVTVGAAFQLSPELRASVPYDKPDYLVPQFILLNLPAGVRALIFAAMLAAAMSSLDSALNSLSAATMRDFLEKRIKKPSNPLLLSKLTTVAWGIAITGFAFIAAGISETVIEAINKIGSMFSGPILAAFLVGVLSKKAHARGIIYGIVAGVAFNLFLWLGFEDIYWMWWNLFGFLMTSAVALVLSGIITSPQPDNVDKYVLNWNDILKEERRWMVTYALLIFYFLLMFSFLLLLQRLK